MTEVVEISPTVLRPRRRASKGPFFLAIALYSPSDLSTVAYFRDHLAGLHQLSGSVVTFIVSDAARNGVTSWLGELSEGAAAKARFPRLKLTDFPCLWLEDGLGGQAVIRLDRADLKVTKILRAVVEAHGYAPEGRWQLSP